MILDDPRSSDAQASSTIARELRQAAVEPSARAIVPRGHAQPARALVNQAAGPSAAALVPGRAPAGAARAGAVSMPAEETAPRVTIQIGRIEVRPAPAPPAPAPAPPRPAEGLTLDAYLQRFREPAR